MILPRQAVETFLPYVEDRAGLDLDVWDTACLFWRFKLKWAPSPVRRLEQWHIKLTSRSYLFVEHRSCCSGAIHSRDRRGCDARESDGGRRFWLNGTNPKRMYVLENVRDFVQLHNLQAGSTLSFYYAPDNRLVSHPRRIPCCSVLYWTLALKVESCFGSKFFWSERLVHRGAIALVYCHVAA